jgi:hypothetical protein
MIEIIYALYVATYELYALCKTMLATVFIYLIRFSTFKPIFVYTYKNKASHDPKWNMFCAKLYLFSLIFLLFNISGYIIGS